MREVIDEVLSGNFGSETGSLDFSQATLELSVYPGEEYEGSFQVYGENDALIKGRVFSTDYRVECLTPEFAGRDAEISYVLHGSCLETGEVVKGAFRVISNLGEYSLPYEVTCEDGWPETSLGTIQNLSDFINLAKGNWQEAVSLFYSDSFLKILENGNSQSIPIYYGLAAYPGREQNMEEFLIHAGKKQCVEFLTETPQVTLEMQQAEGEWHLMEQEISVTRSGWGYVALNVEADGEFLVLEKALLVEEDFLGNYARIPFYVDPIKLKPGINHGKLVFYNSFTSFEVRVTVKNGMAHLVNQARLHWDQAIVKIMRTYERFRTRKMGLANWLDQTREQVDKLIAMNEEDPMPCLFKAQILITQDSQNEAQWLLSHAVDLMERQPDVDEELWAYYLYLTTLLSRDEEEILKVTDEVEQLYRKNPESWRIAWLLLYLSAEFMDKPAEKLRFMEKQFERGCRSFVIYVEALQAYLSNPALLRKLGEFERQVLYYGIRKDYFSPDLAERFLGLLAKDKDYSPILCRILERLYRKRKDARIVQHLCELFVRGGILGLKALPWYEKGVEEQLRITNLYESFMSSIDPEERKSLPKAAVLYFSYQNKLDQDRTAFLYDYVLDNKVLYADVYDKYVLRCRDFVNDQIAKGRINRHLARIYSRMLTPEVISQQNADVLIRLLFTVKIRVKDERMKKLIVFAKGSMIGMEYPLIGGETLAPVYGEDSTLIFEDAFGNRFADEISFETERYLNPDLFLQGLENKNMQSPEFDLYLLNKAGDEPLGDELAEKAIGLCSWEGLETGKKTQICLRLLKQFFEGAQPEKMDELFGIMKALPLTLTQRMEAAKYAVLRGDYEVPYAWMQEFGPYFMDGNTLARLLGNLLAGGYGEEPSITAAVTYLFRRGKASALALDYLSKYGEGHLKDLRDLWKEMRENSLDVTALEERILIQMIFSGAYVAERSEIFEEYYKHAGESSVIKAYVIQSSYDYFVKERTADSICFRVMLDGARWESNLPKVCKLAFLKHYAENPSEVSREVDGALDAFLREMMAEKIHFEFYHKLRHQRHLLGELADKCLVEYRTKPGGRARIHYVIAKDGEKGQEYLSENMRDVFCGICCREFVLFFGETLQYYVTEEIGGEETMTVSGTLQCRETDADAAGTMYGMINDMVMSQGMQDGDALDKALEHYYFKEFCGESLFTLR
ncbi:MAG: hypothetical protein IK081_04050 [Lachnospiraceae bacterium]|nr:hypothetical protein [Lachnospiraceae bacterium]